MQSTTLQIKVANSRFRWILQRTALTSTLWLIDKDMTSGIFEKLDSFWIKNDHLQFHIHTIQFEKVMH